MISFDRTDFSPPKRERRPFVKAENCCKKFLWSGGKNALPLESLTTHWLLRCILEALCNLIQPKIHHLQSEPWIIQQWQGSPWRKVEGRRLDLRDLEITFVEIMDSFLYAQDEYKLLFRLFSNFQVLGLSGHIAFCFFKAFTIMTFVNRSFA